jgi:hypothetical protein
MTTAIIGVGHIGTSVARHLVDGEERGQRLTIVRTSFRARSPATPMTP